MGTVEPINARSMLDAAASAARPSTDRPPIERRRRLSPAALAVTNQKVRRAYSPNRDRGRRAPRRFRAAQSRRHRALSGLCGAALRLPLGICRGHFRHDGDRRGLLPGRRYLRSPGVSRSASADDADDFVLGVRLPAVHRRLVLRQARRRSIAAVALGIFLRRPRRADRRTAVPARDGARLGAGGPARPPHHHRRLRPERRKADRSAQCPGRFRHRYPRRVR